MLDPPVLVLRQDREGGRKMRVKVTKRGSRANKNQKTQVEVWEVRWDWERMTEVSILHQRCLLEGWRVDYSSLSAPEQSGATMRSADDE